MKAPEGYGLLPKGVRCRCVNLWREADGTFWCCSEGKPRGTSEPPKSSQAPLNVADEKALWDRVAENRAIAALEG